MGLMPKRTGSRREPYVQVGVPAPAMPTPPPAPTAAQPWGTLRVGLETLTLAGRPLYIRQQS